MNKILFAVVLLSLLSVALGVCNYGACPLKRCPFGQKPTLHNGDCCPTCSTRGCAKVVCPNLVCGPGSHSVQTDYDCCPVCVVDQGATCANVNCVEPLCAQGYGLVVDKSVSCCPFCVALY